MIYPVTIGIIIITFIFLSIKIRVTTYVMPWSSPLIEMNAIALLLLILIALMWIISYIFFRGTNWMPIYKIETIITQIAPKKRFLILKKLLWFICIYNLILILFSFPTFALVKSGYGYDKGPLGIGVKPKDCKPFEKDKIVKIKKSCTTATIRVIEYNTTYCF